jgi:hypothetical protein
MALRGELEAHAGPLLLLLLLPLLPQLLVPVEALSLGAAQARESARAVLAVAQETTPCHPSLQQQQQHWHLPLRLSLPWLLLLHAQDPPAQANRLQDSSSSSTGGSSSSRRGQWSCTAHAVGCAVCGCCRHPASPAGGRACGSCSCRHTGRLAARGCHRSSSSSSSGPAALPSPCARERQHQPCRCPGCQGGCGRRV